ncbi:hypothetical protein PUR61_16730, partial [Streptomyces sp. BE20]|uniref:hypothetical protein n=1 Tax=Streptomyces sp. BE20 TaxID=3002525 RepID=UPI002E75BF48
VTGNEGGAQPVLGRLFADAGYDCGYGGKWHLPELDLPDGHGFRRLMQEQRDRAKADARAKKMGHADVAAYREVADSSGVDAPPAIGAAITGTASRSSASSRTAIRRSSTEVSLSGSNSHHP